MQKYAKPRPFMECQSRVSGYRREDGKFRGVIDCSFRDSSMDEPEYFAFLCDELRNSPEDALADTRDLFYKLETTSPPTVAFSGHIYSLPTVDEQARAKRWLKDNDHVALYFEREFPGARLVNTPLLGSSLIGGHP